MLCRFGIILFIEAVISNMLLFNFRLILNSLALLIIYAVKFKIPKNSLT